MGIHAGQIGGKNDAALQPMHCVISAAIPVRLASLERSPTKPAGIEGERGRFAEKSRGVDQKRAQCAAGIDVGWPADNLSAYSRWLHSGSVPPCNPSPPRRGAVLQAQGNALVHAHKSEASVFQ